MRLVLLMLFCISRSLYGLETVDNNIEKSKSDSWGDQHKRDEADEILILPSTKSSQDILLLEDLPQNKDWGLVEVDSKTDLEAAEAGLSDNVDAAAETTLDERLVTNAIDSADDEWSWSVSEVSSPDVRLPDERVDTVPITRPTYAQHQSPAPYAPYTTQAAHLLPNLPPPPPGYAHPRAAQGPAPEPSNTTPGPLARLKQKIRTNINTLGSISSKLKEALSNIAIARDGSDHHHHQTDQHHHPHQSGHHHNHQSDHHKQPSDDGDASLSKIRDSIKSALGLPQTLFPAGSSGSSDLGYDTPVSSFAPALPTAESLRDTMTSWLRRGQTVISSFSPPSAPLKVYTRPEVYSGYTSPESQYKTPASSQSGYSASPAQSGYSAPHATAPAQSSYSSPALPPQSGYSSPPAAHATHATHTHGGYASEQSGYSSTPAPSIGYAGLSTTIPIIPVPTYLPIQYDMVQIPPGYQILLQYIVAIVGMAVILAI